MSRTKIPFPVRVPFVESLGLELHACAHGASELRVDLADAHMNSWEVAHGGVLMTLLDVAMATAARSDHLDGPGVATIEMKTSFVRPAEGELLLGREQPPLEPAEIEPKRLVSAGGEIFGVFHCLGEDWFLREGLAWLVRSAAAFVPLVNRGAEVAQHEEKETFRLHVPRPIRLPADLDEERFRH